MNSLPSNECDVLGNSLGGRHSHFPFPLLLSFGYCHLSLVFCLLSHVFFLLSSVFCPLSFASCFLLFCLLSIVFCLLSFVFCLFSSVSCLLSCVLCLIPDWLSTCVGSRTAPLPGRTSLLWCQERPYPPLPAYYTQLAQQNKSINGA